jgi:hypothetical protein
LSGRKHLAFILALQVALATAQAPQTPSLRGRVVDPQGRPMTGASVTLRQVGTSGLRSTTTNGSGVFLLQGLTPGNDYEVSADRSGMASVAMPIRITNAGGEGSVILRLLPRIQFEDVTATSGIDFILQNGGTGHSYQPEIMLGGVAAFDVDSDGCTDVFFTNGGTFPSGEKTGPEYHNRLYRNLCDGTFADITMKAGLQGTGYSIGVGAADYDNDGFPDLIVTGLHGSTLYRNRGDGTFEDVTKRAGLGVHDPKYGTMWGISAGWFDYDNDGYLDLFIANYVAWSVETEQACSLSGAAYFCHPRVYKGLPNQLFRNNHDGTFKDVSESSGVRDSIGKAMGIAFGDFNADGRIDVFVANDSVPNFLFENLGGGKFKEVAAHSGVAYLTNGNAVASMGADFRDADDDGREDIAVTAMYFDTFPLFRNKGRPHYFSDDTIPSGIALATRTLTGWGVGLYDFDNDGRKDLFYACSHFPGSTPFVKQPAAIPNRVMRNAGSGYFEDVTEIAGSSIQQPALYHGAAFADFDNDGRVDVVVSAVNGSARLFRNVSPTTGRWLGLQLKGKSSNGAGIGSAVKVTLPTGAVKYNRATTAVGYASSSEAIVRFGLGPYERASTVEVRWPSGRIQVLHDVPANRVIVIDEE